MKTIKVKPIEAIKIELEDREYICSFNMLAMAYMQEEIGKMSGNIQDISPARFSSLILYSGIKSTDESFTMDEAVALTVQMDPTCYSEIMDEYTNAIYESLETKEKMGIKKVIAQYLASAKMQI